MGFTHLKNIRRLLLLLPTYGYFLSYYYPPLPLFISSGVTYYCYYHSRVYYLLYLKLLFLLLYPTILIIKGIFLNLPCKEKEEKKIPAGSGVVPYISIN